jgi:signal transduction histidine kinase
VAEWLGVNDAQVIPAVATRGEGVLEALKRAAGEFMQRAPGPEAGGPDRPLDRDALALALDRTLAPHADRIQRDAVSSEAPRTPIVLAEEEPLEGAIQTSVLLGEARSVDAARARRLRREADTLHELAGGALQRLQHAFAAGGDGRDDLRVVDAQPLRHLLRAEAPAVVDDLADHRCESSELQSLASAQLPGEPRRAIVAYNARPDGRFEPQDVGFLRSTARHLAAGLDKIRAHQDLTQHRAGLATSDPDRRRPRAGRSRRAVDRLRERFLGNLSSEMRAPLAAVDSAAEALREERCSGEDRERLADAIHGSVALMQRQLDNLSRLIHVVDAAPLRLTKVRPQQLASAAVRLSGHDHIETEVEIDCGSAEMDLESMTRAAANLIDNAVRFSPAGSPVCLKIAGGRLPSADGPVAALELSVLDRGPGVDEQDRERIFVPFAQGTSAASGDGMGIGLYEAACQAHRHGGEIDYEPREGGGSRFRITVPLHPTAEEASTEVTRG